MQATNVVVVDDSHVTATVPDGSGTVDVRVQSGVTTANDPSNVEGTVFGYGVSAVVAADRFTYSTADRPPVAVADTATTTAGTSVVVAVLANDSDPDGDPLTVASVTQPATGPRRSTPTAPSPTTPQPGTPARTPSGTPSPTAGGALRRPR